ncbi:hypothetical protein ACA910_003585 [Epithemia clementina (nom. ined.)]
MPPIHTSEWRVVVLLLLAAAATVDAALFSSPKNQQASQQQQQQQQLSLTLERIHSSKARWPSSFVSVIQQLEKEAVVNNAKEDKVEEEVDEEEQVDPEDEADSESSSSSSSSSSPVMIRAACLLSSQTLTRQELNQVRQVLLGIPMVPDTTTTDREESDDAVVDSMLSMPDHVPVAGFCSRLSSSSSQQQQQSQQRLIGCVCLPQTFGELASCLVATQGQVVFVPSRQDLARGEGLLESLAPVLQMLLLLSSSSGVSTTAKLTVVLPSSSSMMMMMDHKALALAKEQFLMAVEPILSTLVHPNKAAGNENNGNGNSNNSYYSSKPISTLSDIFGQGVDFVSLDQAPQSVWLSSSSSSHTDSAVVAVTTDLTVLNQAASEWPSRPFPGGGTTTTLSPREIAAARLLTPHVKRIVDDCFETVQQATQHHPIVGHLSSSSNDTTTTKLIPAFGELCTAALHSAISEWDQVVSSSTTTRAVATSRTAQSLKAQLLDSLSWQLQGLVQQQLRLQHLQSMTELSTRFSKLLLGPHLARDLHKAAQEQIRDFSHAAHQLSFASSWSSSSSCSVDWVGPAKTQFIRAVQERQQSALLNARASGKFRPLPRQGITVGLHWLLPKPFGNDYRQEPWMVHATDNLVYVPRNAKLMDVPQSSSSSSSSTTDETATTTTDDGSTAVYDWRNQIIPHPSGNELIYTQQ